MRSLTLLIFVSALVQTALSFNYPAIPEILVDTFKAVADRPPGAGLASRYDWIAAGQDELEIAIHETSNQNIGVAKNVILFIGDGMASTTSSAARIYKAQRDRVNGRDGLLTWERFPNVALSRTHNFDRMVPDSSSSATALVTGYKVRSTTVGVTAGCERNKCEMIADNKAISILKYSKMEGKSVGVVTNTRITHATPASSYAHMANRDWENDAMVKEEAPADNICVDIARQLVEENNDIDVALGGGKQHFLPTSAGGDREDNKDLTQDWLDRQAAKGLSEADYKLVTNVDELNAVDTESVKHLLGLFADSHLDYELDKDISVQPTLPQMVEKAIQVLDNNDKGFFLLVEGGRIDHAHHATLPWKAVDETTYLSDAVQKALDLTDDEETLIVVTGDHSHAFGIQGYPSINADIRGLSDAFSSYSLLPNAADDKPFTIMGYINGPGWHDHHNAADNLRKDLTGMTPETDKEFRPDGVFPMVDETHGGEDVPIYATGPLAHLFHATHEESYVAAVMMYASCVGRNKAHCDPGSPSRQNSSSVLQGSILAALLSIIAHWLLR